MLSDLRFALRYLARTPGFTCYRPECRRKKCRV